MSFVKEFLGQEDGAITVDWVVLTAALVVAALTTYWAIANNVSDVTDSIKAFLESVNFS